ncbi:Uncharacterised protein [Klebsiella pneumoniae]|nr:hypothetical protein L382_04832 [Klebsiella pneumoniae MGH 36]OUH69427.1 hypothetical protein AZ029_004700 [Klebsiella pneumoniae]OUR58330.1 hypothetical protein AZZ70_003149 [Klebsiella pneumoniae]SBJ88663.1 Uncharacterised protein [Klebsiella pneumoniae]SWB01866.1 Uncharacterised protein [Klebsiella pneumoniae]
MEKDYQKVISIPYLTMTRGGGKTYLQQNHAIRQPIC